MTKVYGCLCGVQKSKGRVAISICDDERSVMGDKVRSEIEVCYYVFILRAV